MKRESFFNLFLLLLIMIGITGCGGSTTVHTGPYAKVGPVVISLSVDSSGNVTLSGDISQTIVKIGCVGLGWQAGFDHVLYYSKQESNSLFIIWEDNDGSSWEKQYAIGRPFRIDFGNSEWVRRVESDNNGNVFVVVQPYHTPPGYKDLREDIKVLVKRWDIIHCDADRYWKTDDLHMVLQGAALEEQLQTVRNLKNSSCYWTIQELVQPRIVGFEVVSSDLVIVDVKKNWNMDLFCNGEKTLDSDGWFIAKYRISRRNGQWFIIEKQVIEL